MTPRQVFPAGRRTRHRISLRVHSMHRSLGNWLQAEIRIARKIYALRDCQLRTSSSECSPFAAALVAKLIEQRLGVLQVGGVEALGEPVVDLGEHRARLVTAIVLGQ